MSGDHCCQRDGHLISTEVIEDGRKDENCILNSGGLFITLQQNEYPDIEYVDICTHCPFLEYKLSDSESVSCSFFEVNDDEMNSKTGDVPLSCPLRKSGKYITLGNKK